MDCMTEFRLLGPLDVRTPNGVHPIKGVTQQTLLIALVLNANQITPAETLRYEIWGDSMPDSAENALHAHVSRLRRRLERLEPKRKTPRLLSDGSGYRLLVDGEENDAQHFRDTVTAMRRGKARTRPETVVATLKEALAAWRGPVFGGTAGGPICGAGGRHLEQTRREAYELLFETKLRLGHHAQVVTELKPLVRSYSPFLGQFSEMLMIALYRSGRQVEALQAYRQTVRTLLAHGDRPSSRLKTCEQAILTQDPLLELGRRRPVSGHMPG
jgi:DNA-binding SARP family transcriptional activator